MDALATLNSVGSLTVSCLLYLAYAYATPPLSTPQGSTPRGSTPRKASVWSPGEAPPSLLETARRREGNRLSPRCIPRAPPALETTRSPHIPARGTSAACRCGHDVWRSLPSPCTGVRVHVVQGAGVWRAKRGGHLSCLAEGGHQRGCPALIPHRRLLPRGGRGAAS